ncbi:hypothetical protein CB1_000245020 [Camelus ferus]|nr:hypothetical protein CB1_000245020 [Camelus ferus]
MESTQPPLVPMKCVAPVAKHFLSAGFCRTSSYRNSGLAHIAIVENAHRMDSIRLLPKLLHLRLCFEDALTPCKDNRELIRATNTEQLLSPGLLRWMVPVYRDFQALRETDQAGDDRNYDIQPVMLAASYWSLLAPAVEMATSSGGFGALAFFPVAVGFTLGAAFVYLADLLMPHLVGGGVDVTKNPVQAYAPLPVAVSQQVREAGALVFGLWLSLLWDLSAVTLPEDSSASGGNVSQTWEEQPVLKEPRMLQPPPLRPWLPTVMLMVLKPKHVSSHSNSKIYQIKTDNVSLTWQGAAEDPQTALALNFDPALMKKKSDAEGPRPLFPESELSIRIGRAGLPSGKLPAADPGLS